MRQALLDALLSRRSVSPRRLRAPGPQDAALRQALAAALRGPDHGGLTPWRVVRFGPGERDRLAELFVAEKLRREPDADAPTLARVRAQATDPPVLLGFLARIDPAAAVPPHEQWLAAGAALGLLLAAFHALGFGAIVLSGARCADAPLAAALGVAPGEQLVGFVNVGTVDPGVPLRPLREKPVETVLRGWTPGC